jgi:MFS family permease
LVTALAWITLAVAHSSDWEIYAATFVLGIGIGLAFASMVNVIVESVAPEQTGVATGMNVIFRNIGGAMGGQISASILTAAVAVGGYPTEDAFVDSFWLAGGMLLLGFVAALLVPKPRSAAATEPEPAAAA